jgi:predicted nucleic acid-binding protein
VKFVLDTCVVSEFTKPQPNEKLDTWLDARAGNLAREEGLGLTD